MARTLIVVYALLLLQVAFCTTDAEDKKKHHKKHHHKGHHHHHAAEPKESPEVNGTVSASATTKAPPAMKAKSAALAVASKQEKKHEKHVTVSEHDIVSKMKNLEAELEKKEEKAKKEVKNGLIVVNGPLPPTFNALFSKSVAEATGSKDADVKVISSKPSKDPSAKGAVEVSFSAPQNVVNAAEDEAADPSSKLANGELHSFLVAKEAPEEKAAEEETAEEAPAPAATGVDIDVEMPYGDLEPFGREDTAQELTESSVTESNSMVDQLEKAEVAEEKRAVFRALTRLRGAAITSYDGIARSQTGNIDEYNKNNRWRDSHPLHHLASEEADVSKWAFPDNAD